MYENIYHYSQTKQADLLRNVPRTQGSPIYLAKRVSLSERAGDVLISVGQRLKGRSKQAAIAGKLSPAL